MFTKTCPRCNAEFRTTWSSKIYCSNECKGLGVLRSETPLSRNCAKCGEVFETIYMDKLYCSSRCSRTAARERRKERLAQPQEKHPWEKP